MVPSFVAHSKKEAIEKIVDLIANENPGAIKNVDEAKKAVFVREEAMPTGLDHGIAVPHGRTDSVSGIMGAVVLIDNSSNENGIIADYETIDHSELQIIVLTLAPESEKSPYLQFMAYLSKILHNEENVEKLIACKTSEEMKNFFNDRK